MSDRITWITVTYGRVDFVNQLIGCFLAQDYQGERELLILNTFPQQIFRGTFPNVRIVNLYERPSSLGVARNIAISYAQDGILLTADDDDFWLPEHTSVVAKHFSPGVDWVWLSRQYYVESGVIKEITSGSFNNVSFRKSAWAKVGGFPAQTVGEDRSFVGRLTEQCPGVKVPLEDNEITFLYSWGQPNVFHVSGKGERLSAHDEIAAFTDEQVRRGNIPVGDIQLTPVTRLEYIAMAREYVAARKAIALKKDTVCVVQLGRFGDLINILPVCFRIAQTHGKPYLMLCREFATLLDGISYVEPFLFDGQFDQVNEAMTLARKTFKHVICTQIYGRNYEVPRLTESFNKESWRMAGFLPRFYDPDWRPMFDKRDREREEGLVRKAVNPAKPLLLVNVSKSLSSPCPQCAVLMAHIRRYWGERVEILDIGNLVVGRIYDLLGLMDKAAALVSIDTSLLHLAAASNVPVVALVNPQAWLGSILRYHCVERLTYDEAVSNPNQLNEAIAKALTTKYLLVPKMPMINPPNRQIWHAVARHDTSDPAEKHRKAVAQKTWENLYAQGVQPRHCHSFAKTARDIGDKRDLPYLKHSLKFGMVHAADDDIILWTNDDVHLHPDLPGLIKTHVAIYEACASFRCEFGGRPLNSPEGRYLPGSTKSYGQDLFAFTKRWLLAHWEEIPDFFIGASEWDWCLTAIIRQHHWIATTRANIQEPIWPAELPLGYVAHQMHRPAWIHPDNVNAAPSQVHNRRLFARWLAKNIPDFQISQYPGRPPTPRGLNGKELITVRRSNSLGDVLCSTCVGNALLDMGYDVHFQAHSGTHCLLRRHSRIRSFSEPNTIPDVDLDGAYEGHPERRTRHFADLFIDRANKVLNQRGIFIPQLANYAPRIVSDPGVREQALPHMERYPKPWTVICPRSNSWANRTIPDNIWQEAAREIPGTKFWLGNNPAPDGIIDLACRHVDLLVEYIGLSDLLLTVDTGPAHIAASIGTPMVVVEQQSSPEHHFSDQRDFIVVRNRSLTCLNCCDEICRIHPTAPPCQRIAPSVIAEAANKRLHQVTTEDVSAVICVYKPDISRLNTCLEKVLPQVQEVVVVGNQDTAWPLQGVNRDSKITFLQRQASGIGYSRNANYGARHTNGKYLLFLNDDCFLNPDVVEKLRAEMKPGVGAVTHLLRYPNGSIQYAGKHRYPGGAGFGHINHRLTVCSYTQPIEQESVCGASMLVRRTAYYQADGYPEYYELYSEDDHFAMALRQAGWKIIFTPHAVGTHIEHCSTNLVPNLRRILDRSSRIFAEKWGWYFDKNKDVNAIGTFV